MTNLALTVKLKRGNFSLLVEENIPLENVTVLFGESGSGKTTLLRIIAGLEKKAWGKVALGKTYWQNDETKTFLPPHKRSIGYVFQDNRLFNHLNVEGNLRFGHDRSDAKNGVQFNDVVDALDLSNLLLRTPHSLSGGEKQLVSIGRALLSDPELLLMDEPLSALDAKRKAEVIPYIEQLPSNFSIPVLYVTHNLEEVTRLAPNMLLISEGKIVADSTPADLEAQSKYHHAVSVRLTSDYDLAADLSEVDGVGLVEQDQEEKFSYTILSGKGKPIFTQVSEIAQSKNWPVTEFHVSRGQLEDVFRTVTQGGEV